VKDPQHEKNISTESEKTEKDPRISCTHENRRWPSGHQGQTCKGSATGFSIKPAFALSRHVRIKKSETIDTLFNKGEKYGSRSFFASFLRNTPAGVAFIAGKKLGIAVKRMRCKRLLREAYRLSMPVDLETQCILVAKPQILQTPLPDLCKEMHRLQRYIQGQKK
jgi:ribonuclease P protein component